MITIVRPGKKKKQTCYTCGCVFLYENEDVFTVTESRIGAQCVQTKVQCPECGELITTNEVMVCPKGKDK